MIEKNEKSPVLWINDLDTLKALMDPLRLQIIELLTPKPQTINQIAQKAGLSGSRLYYHFRILESSGLIKVVETRMVRNIVEKIYWITADTFEVDQELLNFTSQEGQENVTKIIAASLDATREDIMRSLQARQFELDHGAKPNPRDLVIKRVKKRMRTEVYLQFVEAFNTLFTKFSDLPDEDSEEDEVAFFSIACFLYPSYAYAEEDESAAGEEING